MDLKILFDSFDSNGSGAVDLEEFVNSSIFQGRYTGHFQWINIYFEISSVFFFIWISLPTPFLFSHLAASSDSMFDAVDKDKSGEITLSELFAAYFRYASKKDLQNMEVTPLLNVLRIIQVVQLYTYNTIFLFWRECTRHTLWRWRKRRQSKRN